MAKYKNWRDLRAKAEFARDMADLYEKALLAGAFNGVPTDIAMKRMIAALRSAAEENDPSPKLLDQHGRVLRTNGTVQ